MKDEKETNWIVICESKYWEEGKETDEKFIKASYAKWK